MSCGRNRRRPKLTSTFNSRLRNQHEFSSGNTQPTEKVRQLSRSRKSNHHENLSTQKLHENTIECDRFRVRIILNHVNFVELFFHLRS